MIIEFSGIMFENGNGDAGKKVSYVGKGK